MGTEDEVEAAVEACADAPGLVLFHCVSAYPAPVEECNLRVIPRLTELHGIPVGWSDHTPGLTTALGAVALGAPILEKHFTSDRTLPGPDHLASLEPDALADYVAATKQLALRPRRRRQGAHALGGGERRARPSLVARRATTAGRRRARGRRTCSCCAPRVASARRSTSADACWPVPSRPGPP